MDDEQVGSIIGQKMQESKKVFVYSQEKVDEITKRQNKSTDGDLKKLTVDHGFTKNGNEYFIVNIVREFATKKYLTSYLDGE
jgi:hypothetical protein